MLIDLTLLGNLTADPELRTTKTGKSVCNFTLACNPSENVTRYFEITTWNKLAETCARYLAKGRNVLIKCSDIEASAYTSRSGEAKAALKAQGHLVKFLGSPTGSQQEETADAASVEDGDLEINFYGTGEIPF